MVPVWELCSEKQIISRETENGDLRARTFDFDWKFLALLRDLRNPLSEKWTADWTYLTLQTVRRVFTRKWNQILCIFSYFGCHQKFRSSAQLYNVDPIIMWMSSNCLIWWSDPKLPKKGAMRGGFLRQKSNFEFCTYICSLYFMKLLFCVIYISHLSAYFFLFSVEFLRFFLRNFYGIFCHENVRKNNFFFVNL